MRKYFILAIAALGAFALASCSNEKENAVTPVKGSTVTVTLGEGDKATFVNPTTEGTGFVFQTGDVITWVSETGNATFTYQGDETPVISFPMDIPGLDQGDVEGFFAVNFVNEVPFCFNASNTVQTKAGINTNCFYLATGKTTIAQGTTVFTPAVNVVGGVLAFQFKKAGETVLKVQVKGDDVWCGNGVYDGEELAFDAVMDRLATSVAGIDLTDSYDTQCVFVPVPGDIPSPVFSVYTKSGVYEFEPNGYEELEIKTNDVIKFKMDLDKADNYNPWPTGPVALTAANISSNDPMQYVVGGSDTYGFDSNKDWFAAIGQTQANARKVKYGEASNLFDNDAATCYHTNLDWGEPNTSWGQRSYNINSNRWEKRYIQVTLPAATSRFDLSFKNADSGRQAEDLELLITTNGTDWTTVEGTSFDAAFGAENSVSGVSADGKLISAIRIQNTKGDADWTYIVSAFGIAELSVSASMIDIVDPGKVTNISLDKVSFSTVLGVPVTLNATVYPATAEVTDVVWYSSDESVATVADGVVTPVAVGNATITAKTVDGGFTAQCDVTVLPKPIRKIELTAANISSNDPMQYVVGGSDTYGFDSNKDWFASITPNQKTARENKYGQAANLFDGDVTTCYHTNLDWGEPNTSWGQRSYNINSNREEKRYIEISLPEPQAKVDLMFTTSDSGAKAEGLDINYSTNGTNFTKFGETQAVSGFGELYEVKGIKAESGSISKLRIVNTKGDADWTYIASAFGIAELTVSVAE